MATGTTLPMNPGGRNQTQIPGGAGTLPGGATAQPAFTPASGATGSTNPYMGTVPTGVGTPGTGASPVVNQLQNKQWVDILGKGTGGAAIDLYSGMSGTNSAAYQAFLQSKAPVNAAQMAGLKAQEGAAGISANSSVAGIAESNLAAQQSAQAAGVNEQMILQNQQNQLGMVQNMENLSSKEVASSGWDVFGQVLQGLGNVGGQVLGAAGAAGGFSELFS